jgi:hypothetical protein
MNAREYSIVIKDIASRLEQLPNETLSMNVVQFCRSRNMKVIQKNLPNGKDLLTHIADLYMNYLDPAVLEKEQDAIDNKMRDLHKAPSALDHLEKGLVRLGVGHVGSSNMWFMSRCMHVDIDSLNRNISNDYGTSLTNFAFTMSSRNDRAALGSGIIPTRIIPVNVSYMKIGKVVLPYTATMGAANPMREITLSFTGIRSNGTLISNPSFTETIHFSFTFIRSTINTNLVELTPVNEYCKFDPPLTYLDDLSLRWNDPRYACNFNLDRLTPQTINYASTGDIIFAQAHNLITGDIIVINGLSTFDDAANSALLAQINNPRGIAITKVNDTTINIGINLSLLVSPDNSAKPVITFITKCFRFPLEIGYQLTDDNA